MNQIDMGEVWESEKQATGHEEVPVEKLEGSDEAALKIQPLF